MLAVVVTALALAAQEPPPDAAPPAPAVAPAAEAAAPPATAPPAPAPPAPAPPPAAAAALGPAKPAAASAAAGAKPRLFVATLRAQNAIDPGAVALVGDAVAVAVKKHASAYDVVSAADLKGVLSMEAERQALGCDELGCASELADALDAPQLVTGQIGRVGSTWVLSLTRLEQKTLAVSARAQVQADGEGPDALFDDIDGAARTLFGKPPAPPPYALYGGLTAGAGVAVAVAAGALYGFAASRATEAELALDARDAATARAAIEQGELAYGSSIVAGVAGAVVVVAGAAVAVAGVALGGEP